MDGQHKLGPTQHQNDGLLLDTSNHQKDGARHDSTYAEVVEQASNGQQAGSPMDLDLERELFGSPPNSAVPQPDGSAFAKGSVAMAEAPTADPNSLRDAANQSATGTSNDANDHLIVNEETVASSSIAQQAALVHRTSQSNGIEPQRTDANSDNKASETALMPPPAVPASILTQLQPSSRAKNGTERIEDEAVVARLISVCVILFRQGAATNAKKLAQFTIDLVGQQKWDAELPTFMQAPPLPNDNEAVLPLLAGRVKILKALDRTSSAFLEGMLYAWN